MRFLSLRAKFGLFFAALLGIAIYVGIPAWRKMTTVDDQLDRMASGPFPALNAVLSAQSDFARLRQHCLLIDKMARPKWQERYTRYYDQAREDFDRLAGTSTDEPTKSHAQKAAMLLRTLDGAIKQAAGSNRSPPPDNLADEIDAEIDAQKTDAQAALGDSLRTVKAGMAEVRNTLTMLGTVLAVLWIVVPLVISSALRPLASAFSEAKRLISGDLDSPVQARRGDGLLSALETMRCQLRQQRQDLEEAAVTDKLKLELERVALTDKLTGLANRRKLEDVSHDLLARNKRFNEVLSVIIIDVDKFKSVNDTYGHQVGDQVLIEVAQVLKNHLREVDIVGRWGGEEFIVLCPATSIIGAAKVAEKLRTALERHRFPVVNRKTASFGVAQLADGETLEDTVKRADDALYRAKENGRNRVELA